MEIKQQITTLRQMKMKTTLQQFIGCSKSSYKGKVHSRAGLRQEIGIIPGKQPNFMPK